MMKLLTIMIAILLLIALVGCVGETDVPTAPAEETPIVENTPEPTEQAIPTSSTDEVEPVDYLCYICGNDHRNLEQVNGKATRNAHFEIWPEPQYGNNYLRVYVEACWVGSVAPEARLNYTMAYDLEDLYNVLKTAEANHTFEVSLDGDVIVLTTELLGIELVYYIALSEWQSEQGFNYTISRYNKQFLGPRDNWGVTSARVRLYVYDWFDLSQIEHYHEFIYSEGGFRHIFITDATVRDFRVLSIGWNDDYFDEDADEDERLYSIRSVIYHLDELTPQIPFVMEGVNVGCAKAVQGFSFVDEDGVVRYFAFHSNGYDGYPNPYIIREF